MSNLQQFLYVQIDPQNHVLITKTVTSSMIWSGPLL